MKVKVVSTGITDVNIIKEKLTEEGYSNIFSWSDSPNTFYDWHTHSYREVRWVYKGSITIGYESGEVKLKPGDRMDIEPNTKHWAKTEEGVSYICGSKY
jgi:quercetin dioxygenase-like cupin family protein